MRTRVKRAQKSHEGVRDLGIFNCPQIVNKKRGLRQKLMHQQITTFYAGSCVDLCCDAYTIAGGVLANKVTRYIFSRQKGEHSFCLVSTHVAVIIIDVVTPGKLISSNSLVTGLAGTGTSGLIVI